MTEVTIQIPSLVLPQVWTQGTETESINDLVQHPSIDIPVDYLQEKVIHVYAAEVVIAGAPGNLQIWIEISPYPSTLSTVFWAMLGTPVIVVATGVHAAAQTVPVQWTTHSPYARVVAQMPVAAAPATAFWVIQALVSAKR